MRIINRLLLLVLISAIGISATAFGQNRITLKGKVSDKNTVPVPGAVIMTEDKSSNTITDLDGLFEIQVEPDAVIEVSCLGFTTLSVSVSNRSYMDIILEEEYNSLDEIVVVGYGTQRKKDLTGAIASVNMEKFGNQQSVSIADYLRGSVAGLNISRSSSLSGQDSFQIRGETSLGASCEPLLVVDGIIYGGSLGDINPNDVESISVMKDASSAAVYGASGAGGVILISTKKGKGDKPTIRFDLKHSLAHLFNPEEMYKGEEYLDMRADAIRTRRGDNNWQKEEYYTNPYKLQNTDLKSWIGYDAGRGENSDPTAIWLERLELQPMEIENYYERNYTDWYNETFRTGQLKDYNVSVSGSTNKLSYYWSVGFLDNDGVVKNDKYRNVRSRINLTNDITDWLQVGVRAFLSSANSDGQAAEWAEAYQASPLGDVYDADGNYSRYPNDDIQGQNPLEKTQFDNMNRSLRINGTVFAKIRLPFGFSFESSYDNRWQTNQNYTYKPSYTIDAMKDGGVAEREDYKAYEWTIENMLKWNKTFGEHRIDVTLLQSAYRWSSWQTVSGASLFSTSEALGYHNMGLGDIQTAGSMDQTETKASYMARVNWSLKDRYFLSASWRMDGFSGFGQDNPWAHFPGVSAAWRISEENWMKNASWLSNLKLRASYGRNGNSNFGRYKALAAVSNGYYINNGSSVVTLYPSAMGNKTLSWEQTSAYNVGIDLGLWKNRLSLTLEGYLMKTTNQLLDRSLPTISGFNSVISNLGQIDNKGFELSISSVNINRRNFKWNTDLAVWLNRNRITHLYGEMEDILDENGTVIGQKEADDPTNGWYIGHAIDEIYGYEIVGVWQESEIEEARQFGFVPGDYKTYAAPGHTSLSSEDYTWQGYKKPRVSFSIRNSMSFFNDALEFSFMIRSELGHKKASNEICVGSYADRVTQYKYPYWTYENPSDYWGRLGAKRTGTLYRSASFVRIDNLSLCYNFPAKLLSKAKIQGAKISFNVDNVYSFDNWLYWDVETKSPIPTTFTLGLSITL